MKLNPVAAEVINTWLDNGGITDKVKQETVRHCVRRYAKPSGCIEKLQWLISRIVNAFKSLCGRSDWQKAVNILTFDAVPKLINEDPSVIKQNPGFAHKVTKMLLNNFVDLQERATRNGWTLDSTLELAEEKERWNDQFDKLVMSESPVDLSTIEQDAKGAVSQSSTAAATAAVFQSTAAPSQDSQKAQAAAKTIASTVGSNSAQGVQKTQAAAKATAAGPQKTQAGSAPQAKQAPKKQAGDAKKSADDKAKKAQASTKTGGSAAKVQKDQGAAKNAAAVQTTSNLASFLLKALQEEAKKDTATSPSTTQPAAKAASAAPPAAPTANASVKAKDTAASSSTTQPAVKAASAAPPAAPSASVKTSEAIQKDHPPSIENEEVSYSIILTAQKLQIDEEGSNAILRFLNFCENSAEKVVCTSRELVIYKIPPGASREEHVAKKLFHDLFKAATEPLVTALSSDATAATKIKMTRCAHILLADWSNRIIQTKLDVRKKTLQDASHYHNEILPQNLKELEEKLKISGLTERLFSE